MTVDPTIDRWELQARLIYSALVAGKSAAFARKVFERLLGGEYVALPFNTIRRYVELGKLPHWLRYARSGSYTRLGRCLPELIKLDPETCTVEELEAVHGIGPKTARFFILWTRPGARYAALDTHILKFLRSVGYNAPKSTPTGRKYRELEIAFLAEADRRRKTPRDFDWEVWDYYSQSSKEVLG